MNNNTALSSAIIGFTATLALAGVSFAGWITHVILCIQTGNWGFLIAGAIAAPIGVIHGIGHWFGAW